MSAFAHCGPVALWHRRILGGFWAFCATFLFADTLGNLGLIGAWSDRGRWILAPISAGYLAVSVGFIFGHPWARNTMVLLMTFTAIISMFLSAGGMYFGDPYLFWWAAVS